MKKYTSAIIVVFLVFASLVVIFGLNSKPIEELIRPPQQHEKGNDIRKTLSVEVGKGYILKPPVNGEYRSAFIYYDVDSDGNEEAVVFCSKNKVSDKIIMLVFSFVNNEWKKISSVESDFTKVNEVKFSDCDCDGNYEIIVGWNYFENTLLQKLSVFKILSNDEKTNCIFEADYSNFTVCDVDYDLADELVIFNRNELNSNYIASFYKYKKREFVKVESFGVDPMISSINCVNSDYIRRYSITRLYIDGYTSDGRIVTDVINWDINIKEFQRVKINGENISSISNRNLNFSCDDLNKDGIIEIPIRCKNSDPELSNRIICWVDLEESKIKELYYYLDFNEAGYYLKMKDDEFDLYYFTIETETYSLKAYDAKTNELMFEIIRTDENNNNDRIGSFKLLCENRNCDYYYKITSRGTLRGISKRYLTDTVVYY